MLLYRVQRLAEGDSASNIVSCWLRMRVGKKVGGTEREVREGDEEEKKRERIKCNAGHGFPLGFGRTVIRQVLV